MGWKSSRWDSTVKESVFWAEGGPVADVGDGLEVLGGGAGADGQRGDVDAVGGEQLGVRCEVDGGDGVAGAVAAT